MKKVIGLCLVVLLSSGSVFAQEGRRMDKKPDDGRRCERMISELKLNEQQAAEFRKVNEEFMKRAEKEREEMKAFRDKQREKMRTMESEKDAQLKKILTDEQYKQYLEKKQSKGKKRPHGYGRN